MSDPVTRLASAEAAATLAREHLHVTLGALQARLEPKRLARNAASEMTVAGRAAAQRGVRAARGNPGALAGVVAVTGLFLARHRIASLFRRRREATADSDAS